MPCLMANALGPSNYYSDYSSLHVDYVSSEQIGEEEYRHTYRLHNYGDGYIDYISIRDGEDTTYNYYSLNSKNISDIFSNALYKPGYGGEVTFTSQYPIINTSSPVGYNAKAYKSGSYYSLSKIKGIKYVGLNENEYADSKYIYEVEFQMSYNRDAIFHFDYDGNEYCVISKTSGGSNHRIYTFQEIDIEKLSVTEFFLIEPHVTFKIDDGAVNRAMIILLVGFLVLVSLIVFPAVFIPAMVRRSRRNRAKAAKK